MRQECRTLPKGQEAPFGNPRQKRGAQEKSGIRVSFFWILFFGQAKKSISVVGPRTDIKLTVASATHHHQIQRRVMTN
ncbi:[NiFe] hydrogenase metallocenter assembly protein HypC [Methylomonas fluvii]|nr:[NiFe] hydrogenase metallocenter assembly protein HypC [Methylomonas fluvii]